MTTFRAIRVDKDADGYRCAATDFDDADLMPGDVTVAVSHSTVNYKDGLAVTGGSPVVRRFPMIPGIDFAGVVETSGDARFKAGDAVLLTGWGVGETHLGGFAERARVKGDWLTPLPRGLSARDAMAIGTAGLTAMLCVLRLERLGADPARGPVIVTGAAGGVGSVAIALLAKAGWRVVASTGRPAEEAFLKNLGAAEIIDRKELSAPGRPLGKERWIAGVDAVGSHTLANVLAQTKYGGVVAAAGLAQGMDLPTTVAPFILRGVTLAGVDSVMCPAPSREEAWARLSRDLDRSTLASMSRDIGFDDIIATAGDILGGKVRGRVVARIR